MNTENKSYSYTIELKNVEETLHAGKILAESLQKLSSIKILLLFGDLGAGKTTFTRGFVSAFKNAEHAEVTSPSFTLVNHYPTKPPIIHADLYRLAEMANITKENLEDNLEDNLEIFPELPEELEYNLYENSSLSISSPYVLVEWADFLNIKDLRKRLDIFLKVGNTSHSLEVKAYTKDCEKLFQELGRALN